MRASFESSHISRDFSSGELTVRVVRDDAASGTTRADVISFSVPRDFHTHNDSVAAALLIMSGFQYAHVTFNFPVSTTCAELLREHYHLDEVGPVDPDLEPRRRGPHLGLLLSGGLDSMAIWLLLRRALDDDFKVLTTEFGGGFAFEELGYSQFRRDVSCRTDFRRKHVHSGVRFTHAVALLFADYVGLGAVTSGQHFGEVPLSIGSLRDGGRPAFLDEDRSMHAGGLDEIHIARSLNSIGLLQLGLLAEPAMLEACWYGSAPPGTLKHYHKGLGFRILYERMGRGLPPWLENLAPPRNTIRFGGGAGLRFTVLYIMRYLGIDVMRPEFSDIDCFDLSFLDDLSLTFMERYNPNLIQYIPEAQRPGILACLHQAEVGPYSESDWDELGWLREFNLAVNEDRALVRPLPGCVGATEAEETARARLV